MFSMRYGQLILNSKAMTTQDFKKGTLIFSGTCKGKEDLEQKLSQKVYYNSKLSLTMFAVDKGVQWFYLVNYKGDINQKKVATINEKSGKFQYRYFLS
jgi:hypothetical protein